MVQKEGSITLINLEEGYLQYFWHQGAKYSDEIPAGTYVTQVTEEEFKRNLTGQPNLLLRADSVNLRSGKDIYLQAGVIEDNTNLTGIKIFKGGLEAGTFNSDDYIYAWGGEDRNDRTISINSSGNKKDWRLIAGKKFGVDKAGNLYAENVHISGTVTVGSGSNVYTTDDTNPLLVGGRNLLLSTSMPSTRTIALNADNFYVWDTYQTYIPINTLFKVDDLVTVSFDWETNGTDGNFRIECGPTAPWVWGTVINAIGTRAKDSVLVDITSSNKSGHVEVTFKVTSQQTSAPDTFRWLRIRVDGANMASKTFTISNAKAERGNKATDWTPAPEDVQAEIDGIEIGGRNLLRETALTNITRLPSTSEDTTFRTDWVRNYNSPNLWNITSFSDGANQIEITLNSTSNLGIAFGRLASDIALDPNSEYTLSCWAKCTISGAKMSLARSYYNTNNSWVWRGGENQMAFNAVNTWQRFTLTFKPDVDTKGITYAFLSTSGSAGGTGKLYIRHCKLEKGNKATDWTPAPEDISSDTNLALSPMAEWKSNYHCARINLSENLVANQTYTLQIWDVAINNTPAGGGLAVYWGGGSISLVPNKAPDSTGYWTATFIPTAAQAALADAKHWYLNIYNTTPSNAKTARDCTFSKVKLQKGAIGTQWSECPASSGNGKNLLYGTASMWNGGGNYKTKTFRYTGSGTGALSHMTFASVADKNGLPEGLTGFIRVTNTSGGVISGDMGIAQDGFTGDVNFTGGQTYTLSCWVRSNKRDYTIALQPIWSSGGTTGRKSVATTDTCWQYVSATLTLATAQQTSYSGGYVVLIGSIAAGDYIDIAGVKLEEGPYATGWDERGEYITYIDATNGIRVYSGVDVTDYLQLNSDAITMVRNNVIRMRQDDTSLIFYDGGNNARLQLSSTQGLITGRTDKAYTQTTDSGLYIYNGASTQTNKKLAQVTGGGLEVFDAADGTSAAIFGATARIGKQATGNKYVIITSSGLYVRKKVDASNTKDYLTITDSWLCIGDPKLTRITATVDGDGPYIYMNANGRDMMRLDKNGIYLYDNATNGRVRVHIDATNGMRIYNPSGQLKATYKDTITLYGGSGTYPLAEISSTALTIAYSNTYKTVVNSSGMHVYAGDASNSVAFFGETTRIGYTDSAYLYLSPDTFRYVHPDGNTMACSIREGVLYVGEWYRPIAPYSYTQKINPNGIETRARGSIAGAEGTTTFLGLDTGKKKKQGSFNSYNSIVLTLTNSPLAGSRLYYYDGVSVAEFPYELVYVFTQGKTETIDYEFGTLSYDGNKTFSYTKTQSPMLGRTRKYSIEYDFGPFINSLELNSSSYFPDIDGFKVSIGSHLSTSINQFVLGTYNSNKSTNIFEIGNGTSSALKNIFEVDRTGNVNIAGDLKAANIGNNNITGGGTGTQVTGVSIPSGTSTPITSVVIPKGVWMITYLIRFSVSGSGIRLCNMAQTRGSTWRFATAVPVPTGETALNGTQFVNLTAPTTYYFNAYQNSGSALTASIEYWRVRIN